MAIFLFNNKLNAPSLDSIFINTSNSATWSGEEWLTKPQLNPAMVIDIGGGTKLTVDASWTEAVPIHAVALWGVDSKTIDAPATFTVLVNVNSFPAEDMEHVSAKVMPIQATPFSPAHVVILLDQPVMTNRVILEVRYMGGGSFGAERFIGALSMCEALESEELADFPNSTQLVDGSSKIESEGGQVYTSSDRKFRRITIPTENVSRDVMFNHLVPGRVVQDLSSVFDSAPDNLSGVVSYNAGTRTLTASGLGFGSAGWNVGALGKSYLLTFDARSNIAVSPQALQISNRAVTGFRSVHIGPQQSSSLTFVANTENDDVVTVKLLGLWEVDIAPSDAPLLSDLQQIQAAVGTSEYMGIILRPSDPLWAADTTFYGLVSSWRPFSHLDGDVSRGGLVLDEAR